MDYSEILPKIIGKAFTKDFNPEMIYQSLLKETTINIFFAKKITDNVCRFLIGNCLQLITAPLIREIVNVELLKLGLEKERLQYTRIGFPFYDLYKMIHESDYILPKYDLILKDKLIKEVFKEFNDVKKLIENKL